mgnify:CR=1 FL=1
MRARSKLALFRADASAAIGSGHVRRCLAVATALKRDGWTCRFAVGGESLSVVPELIASDFEVHTLDPASLLDAAALSDSVSEGCELLVVDHYGLDRKYEAAARRFARNVLAIDDLADRDHDCNVLVDATAGRNAADYASRVPAGASLLLGSAYAPLRPAFAALRTGHVAHSRSAQRMLVNFGGTDPDDMTGAVLTALSKMDLPAALQIDVVLGRGACHAARIARQLAGMADNFHLHLDVPDMAELLTGADLAIGAGGVSALERCCLGVPSVVVVIADNQREVATALAEKGAARLACSASDAARQATVLLEDRTARQAISIAAMALCDGRGAARIALWVDPEEAKKGQVVRLRPTETSDEAMILAWQTQPETRRHARIPHVPTVDEHRAWFAAKCADPDCLFNVVLCDGKPVGTVRLDRHDRAGWEVSIAIDTAHHGIGIGRAALALARRLVPEAPLLAGILPGNQASLALFAKAGYVEDGDWYVSRPH